MATLNPYTILEVTISASAAEIKAAYKKLAFRHHPDRNQGSHFHTERFKQIAEAYELLSNPDKRARYDRHLAHGYVHRPTAPHAAPPSRPNPYGNRHTYDPFRTKPTTGRYADKSFSGKGGRRYTYATPHQIFIALTLLACIGMFSLWFDSLMARNAAEGELAKGDYVAALQFDSTYGDAWFYKGTRFAAIGGYERAILDMDHGMALVESIPADWQWQHGRVAEHLGQTSMALGSYRKALVKGDKEEALLPALKDSVHLRLAGLLLHKENRPEDAYLQLARISPQAHLSPQLQYLRGMASLRTGRFSESAPLLQAAADAGYESGNAYYYLGTALLATADTASACRAWDIALTSGQEAADSLLRRYCTFTVSRPSGPLNVHVQSGSKN